MVERIPTCTSQKNDSFSVIGPVLSEVSAYSGSGNHMPHSEGANAIERTLSILLERDRFAVADLLHPDQWHSGKHFGVLRLLPEFVEGAHLRHHDPRLCPGVLEIVSAPLPNSFLHGFGVGAALQKVEGASGELRVDIQGDDVPAVLRFAEKREFEKRVEGIPKDRRTSIDGFPFQIEETGEAPQRLADIHRDVLSLTGPVSPNRCDRDGLGG